MKQTQSMVDDRRSTAAVLAFPQAMPLSPKEEAWEHLRHAERYLYRQSRCFVTDAARADNLAARRILVDLEIGLVEEMAEVKR